LGSSVNMSKQDSDANDSTGIVRSKNQAFNARAPGYGKDFFSDSSVEFSPAYPNGRNVPGAYLREMQGALESFPDGQVKPLVIFGQGEWVCAEELTTGTNTGPLRTGDGRRLKPTNRPIAVKQLVLYRVQAGKITEVHSYPDQSQIRTQLGLSRLQRKTVLWLILFLTIGLALVLAGALPALQNYVVPDALLFFLLFSAGLWFIVTSIIVLRRWLLSYSKGPPVR
jgi:predicted ester cyclase